MTKEEFYTRAFKYDEPVVMGRRSGKVKAINWDFDEIKIETNDEFGKAVTWYSREIVNVINK